MFGTYRTFLAVLVVFLHLGGMPVIGGYAVFGFYILSGYLMTHIMNINYGYTRKGIAKYSLNRFLRIYPIYWLASLISVFIALWFGADVTKAYHSAIYLPENLKDILGNIFLFFPNREEPRLTPPAWALTVEIFYYICIGVGLSRTRLLSTAWFFLAVIYTFAVNMLDLDWEYKYFIIPAASLPFSTGALIFHYRHKCEDLIKIVFGKIYIYAPYMICISILLNWSVGYHLDTLRGISFYINYVLCVMALVSLLNRENLLFISKKTDKLMGDFSYPIYLIHYQVGFIVIVIFNYFGFSIQRPDPVLAIVSLPSIFLVAWLLSKYIEIPIELVRSKIRIK